MTTAAAAKLAATRKEAKFVEQHHFNPLVFKSLGQIGSKATNFFKRAWPSLITRYRQPYENSLSVPAPVCSIAVP